MNSTELPTLLQEAQEEILVRRMGTTILRSHIPSVISSINTNKLLVFLLTAKKKESAALLQEVISEMT
jgi:hypothetical protein